MQKEEEETGTKYLSIEQTTSLIGATVQRNHDDQTNPCGEQEQFAEPVSLVLFDAYLRKECEFDCKNMEVSQNSYSDDCKVETSTHGDLMLRTAALLRKRHHVKIKHVPIGRDIGEMTVETTLRRFAAAVASVMVDGVMFDETADIARMSVVVITIHLPFEDPRFAFLLNALAKSKNVLAVYIPLECVPGCDIEYMLVSGETIEMKQSGSACMLLNAMERANTALSSSSSSTREDMAPSLSLLHPMRVRQMQTLLLKRLSQFWETCKKEPFELKHIVSSDGRIQETLIRKKKKKEGGGHTLEKKPVQEHGPRKRRALIIGCDCGRNDGIIRTLLPDGHEWGFIEVKKLCKRGHVFDVVEDGETARNWKVAMPVIFCRRETSLLFLPPHGLEDPFSDRNVKDVRDVMAWALEVSPGSINEDELRPSLDTFRNSLAKKDRTVPQ